ncbi:hypothetical protein EJD97_020488 [Solanum chilense]|uniref:Uncharacterized protein n=1 Tax=Solanum chilense TaxID=4083 RepID=A0A6N2AZ92_SOLCI|nr:hypothetical protein EJD97_020488 [Solanum chilense]
MPTEEESTHDLTVYVATTVAALLKRQEQGSLIDANLLVRFLFNLDETPKLMNECGMATNAATVVSRNIIMSRLVNLLVPLSSTKPEKVINKPINECQAPHAGSGQNVIPKPMTNFVPLTITMKSDLVNEQGTSPQVETTNIRETKSIAYSTS